MVQPYPKNWFWWLVVLVSGLAYGGLAYFTARTQFNLLLGWWVLLFAGYIYLVRTPISLKTGLWLACFFRLLFLLAYPQLSDDYFRFIWDGTLLTHGENPYLHLPSFYRQPQNLTLIPELTADFYQRLNSPQYYSVYPPVCQFFFGLVNFVGQNNIWLNCIILRCLILLAEAGTLFFLLKILRFLGLPQRQIWLYALNPLIIVELTGNLHPEAWLIFFLLASFYLVLKNRITSAAILLALAVGVKMWPLMFLPLIWRQLGFRAFIKFSTIVFMVLILLFLPFLSPDLLFNMLKSVNLYFQKFEFNASIYYLSRWLGYRLTGYNYIALIGPVLSGITTAVILYVAFRPGRGRDWSPAYWWQNGLFTVTCYLALATVVHPWYLSTLVALATCSRWRYPLLWSGVVILSYATYRTSAYAEVLWLTAAEYALVYGYLAYETRTKFSSGSTPKNP